LIASLMDILNRYSEIEAPWLRSWERVCQIGEEYSTSAIVAGRAGAENGRSRI
jgi:hypothetical protein